MIKIFEQFKESDEIWSCVDGQGKVDTSTLYDMAGRGRGGKEKQIKFEYYLKTILVDQLCEFNGATVDELESLYNRNLMGKHVIKIKDVHVIKEGDRRSTIYFIDDKNNIYFAGCSDIKIVDENFAEIKKKKDEELNRKREEIRLRHIHHDPYGEENWMEENYIFEQFIDVDPYGEENWEVDIDDIEVGDGLKDSSWEAGACLIITRIKGELIEYDKNKYFKGWKHFITRRQLKKWLDDGSATIEKRVNEQ
jgi:hypothetical protein